MNWLDSSGPAIARVATAVTVDVLVDVRLEVATVCYGHGFVTVAPRGVTYVRVGRDRDTHRRMG